MLKVKINDIVLVNWVDSSHQPGWLNEQDCHIDVSECQSVGFVVEQNEKGICLASDRCITPDHRPYASLVSIPVQAITKMIKLKV